MTQRIKLAICLAVFLCLSALSFSNGFYTTQARQNKVDFKRDIEPIFAANCYGCHGPKKASSQLRLDAKAAAMKGGLSGAVIVPGKSKESRLLHRILGLNDEARMPMGGAPLKAEQIELIRRWIDEGAVWPDGGTEGRRDGGTEIPKHWAFVAPQRPALPSMKNAAWARTPVDRFYSG